MKKKLRDDGGKWPGGGGEGEKGFRKERRMGEGDENNISKVKHKKKEER